MNDGGGVPPGVFVFAGKSSTNTRTAYLQSTKWTQVHRRGSAIEVGAMSSAYKIGFQVRDLILLVAFAPRPGVEFITAAGVHVPLNPASMLWPCCLAPVPEEPMPPLWFFTRSLAAMVP